VPRIDDLTRIRAVLERDRAWSAYALGDLSPEFLPHCEWRTTDDDEALVMVFRGFDLPILFAMGDAHRLAAIVEEVDAPRVWLHVLADAVPSVASVYSGTELQHMWRMAVDRDEFCAAGLDEPATPPVETLTRSDLPALEQLFADGRDTGERPHFFSPQMLDQGTYRGVRQHGVLVAAAGTHLLAPVLGVCAIGNVYTRRDCRGQGLAARLTSAVVAHAFSSGVSTIVLNVRQTNEGARRVYERLGFRRHCAFVEGLATRYPSRP